MDQNDFLWLLTWYRDHCNGDWEHEANIHIGTIDNPGWSITINLEDTELQSKHFETYEFENSNEDWLICFIKNNKFEGRCGVLNLPKILQIFRGWAENP